MGRVVIETGVPQEGDGDGWEHDGRAEHSEGEDGRGLGREGTRHRRYEVGARCGEEGGEERRDDRGDAARVASGLQRVVDGAARTARAGDRDVRRCGQARLRQATALERVTSSHDEGERVAKQHTRA
jgi:hypothetical protein